MDASECGDVCISCDLDTMIPLLYAVPSFILYFVVIHMICKNKEFHSIFYTYYAVIAISNCSFWICQNIFDRLMRLTMTCTFFLENFGEPNYWFFLIKLIYLYCPLLTFITSTLLILNRLTAICFPVTIHSIWENYQQKIAFLQFFLPLLFAAHAAFWKTALEPVSWRSGLVIRYVTTWPHLPLGIFNSVVGGVCVSIIILSTAYTFFVIYSNKIRSKSKKSIEYNLFLTAFFLASATILFCTYQLVYFGASQAKYRRLFYRVAAYRGGILDVYALLPAWIFVLIQKKVRHRLLVMLHLKKTGTPITTISVNNSH